MTAPHPERKVHVLVIQDAAPSCCNKLANPKNPVASATPSKQFVNEVGP